VGEGVTSNKMKKMKTACVTMTGPDVQMDQRGDSYEPANALPAKCPHCSFPDLDFVTKPYVLTKAVSSPAETSPAQVGNFLVRERVRRILEIAVPGACTFHPTIERKSKKPAPWWLVVPTQKLVTLIPKPTRPFCSKCHEPKLWSCAMGPVWEKMHSYDSGGIDIFKSVEWYSNLTAEDRFAEGNRYRKKDGEPAQKWSQPGIDPPTHDERWTRLMLDRQLYFSVRLEQLFKRAKVKGQLVRSYYFKGVATPPEDEAWIEEKLQLLAKHGLAEAPKQTAGKAGGTVQEWFKQFLKRSAKKRVSKIDFAAIEKKQKLALPKDYKDFVSTVGSMSFQDVMESEGFTATVLLPTKLDFKDYRRGRVSGLDKEQSQIDGVMFAETQHGDAFVFDVSAKGSDYPVLWYDHEQNTLEPFAPNFAECIKRFSKKN
jgi:hypothetical protein